MSLKKKITFSLFLTGTVPILSYFIFSGYIIFQEGINSKYNLLTQMNLSRKKELEKLASDSGEKLKELSQRRDILNAFQAFSTGFRDYPILGLQEKKTNLLQFYKNQFLYKYKEKTNNDYIEKDLYLSELSDRSIVFQYDYISNNSNPLGQKNKLKSLPNTSLYNDTHERYYKELSFIIESSGLYDIFFIDTEGNIIYSYFKEVDFSANLKSPVLKKSGLGLLFQKMQNSNHEELDFSDIEPYFASYESPASFAMIEIYDNNRKLGYIAIQLPVPLIDTLLSNKSDYMGAGMGKTGETVLIGLDFVLKSNNRKTFENLEESITYLENLTSDEKNYLLAQQTGALVIRWDSPFLESIVENQKYKGVTIDFFGNKVLGLGELIQFGNHKYILISKFDTSEVYLLFFESLGIGVLILIGSVVLVSIVSVKVSTSLLIPILKVSDLLANLRNGDISNRFVYDGKDEIQIMGSNLNSTLSELQSIFQVTQLDWKEISKQKQNEELAKAKMKEALSLAESEKEFANKQNQVAILAKEQAEIEKRNSEDLANKQRILSKELQSKVDQILQSVDLAKNGNLLVTIPVVGDDAIGRLSLGLKVFLNKLGMDFKNIDELVVSLYQASIILDEKSKSMKENADENQNRSLDLMKKSKILSNNIQSMSSATEKMKTDIIHIADQANRSLDISNKAVNFIKEMQNSGERLRANSDEINKLVNVINTISRQTNLLALNAMLESARAGVAGKGFSIVANEVKELSNKTGNSSVEITKKLDEIKSNTTDLLNYVDQINVIFGSINQSSKEVANSTNSQIQTADNFLDITSNSVYEINEVHSTSVSISESANSGNKISKENADLARELKEASEKLEKVLKTFQF